MTERKGENNRRVPAEYEVDHTNLRLTLPFCRSSSASLLRIFPFFTSLLPFPFTIQPILFVPRMIVVRGGLTGPTKLLQLVERCLNEI